MTKVSVLIEVDVTLDDAFQEFEEAVRSEEESVRQSEQLLESVAGLGIELESDSIPVPMFIAPSTPGAPIPPELEAFPIPETNPDLPSASVVIPALVDSAALEELAAPEGMRVWPNSELTIFASWDPALRDIRDEPTESVAVLDAPGAPVGLDCRPFRGRDRRDSGASRRLGALGGRLPRRGCDRRDHRRGHRWQRLPGRGRLLAPGRPDARDGPDHESRIDVRRRRARLCA